MAGQAHFPDQGLPGLPLDRREARLLADIARRLTGEDPELAALLRAGGSQPPPAPDGPAPGSSAPDSSVPGSPAPERPERLERSRGRRRPKLLRVLVYVLLALAAMTAGGALGLVASARWVPVELVVTVLVALCLAAVECFWFAFGHHLG